MLDGIKVKWRQKKTTGHFVKKQQITVWSVEVAIPLVWLGKVDGREGNASGFDIVWHDADHEGKDIVAGTWQWAGNSTNMGTLFFGKRHRTLDESLLTRSPNKPGLNHVFIEKEIFKILINNSSHLHSILTQCSV